MSYYVDIFWSHHGIFIPHKHLLEPMTHSFPFVCTHLNQSCDLCSKDQLNGDDMKTWSQKANNKLNRLPWNEKYSVNCWAVTYISIKVFNGKSFSNPVLFS